MSDFITLIAWWGGTLFLLNKCFFLGTEIYPSRDQEFRVRSWQVYLVGLPAWLIVFYYKSDFIALAVEAAGFPSMVLGLLRAQGNRSIPPEWDKRLERTSFLMVPVGIGVVVSAWYFSGLYELTQGLEALLAAGFLIGTRLLVDNRRTPGYAWYLLMNGANTALMYMQHEQVLGFQQASSVVIVVIALGIRLRRKQT